MFQLTFDIQGLQRQIEQKKREIYQGIIDGFEELGPILEDRMKVYMDDIVYKAYIRHDNCNSGNPHYERTGNLLNSIRSEIVGNILYIWSGENLDYAKRVLEGGEYDFPWLCPDSEGDFRVPRNWIEPTKMEIINHFHQGGQLINILIEAIRKKIS